MNQNQSHAKVFIRGLISLILYSTKVNLVKYHFSLLSKTMNRFFNILGVWVMLIIFSVPNIFVMPSLAADPPYQPQMQQLLNSLGSLYYLQPLCGARDSDWRQHAQELIALDQPNEDRMQRLNGSFNQGYHAYARLHQTCTPATQLAISRLLNDADRLTRDIRSRYSEQN